MWYNIDMKPVNPFIISGYRGPEYFCDREKETQKVISALVNERNVTLMAPRRYGKTGLIKNVFHRLGDEFATVYIDIYATNNLREFTEMLANSVIGALDTTSEKALQSVGRFFKALRPVVTPEAGGGFSFSLSVEKDDAEVTLKGVFDYLASKDRRIVVAIDEFQQILNYPEKGTEALLRGYIQFLENTSFIFAGSRHHLMSEMFAMPKHPFYNSTDIMELSVIDKDVYSRFVEGFLAVEGRGFSLEAFSALYARFDGVTWYVQSVLNRIWANGGGLTTPDQVERMVADVLSDRALTYHDLFALQNDVAKLLLKGIARERCVSEITAGGFLARHHITAPSSVRAALPALLENDLVYRTDKGYIVYDYLFAEYLRSLP